MKQVSIILLYLLLTSCETALDIEIPSAESKLVINSYMIADEYWDRESQFLIVSNSIGSMVSTANYIYTDSIPIISNATASINEINSTDNIINEYPLEFDSLCYCYTHPTLTTKENTTYELNVHVNGYPDITATDKIPQKPTYTVSNLTYDLTQDSSDQLCSFNIKINDIINQKNYYRLIVRARKTFDNTSKSCIYEVDDPSFLIPINRYNSSNSFFKGKNGYFTDELFEGEEKDFFITVNKPDGEFDHFTIEVISYSEKLYNFNLTRKEQRRDSNNILFNSEAIFIDSNIEGGYGIFGGRARSRRAYGPTYPDSGIEY